MIDTGHVETDELILQIEKKVKREYQQAAKEIQEKLDKYFLQYMEQDEDWRKRVKAGEITQEQYEKWRMAKIQGDKRWNQLETQLAKDLHNSNLIARSIIQGYMPEVYAINHNFGTYLVEMDGNIDTSYTLYSRESVERILRDDPDLLPPPGRNLAKKIAANKDIRWQAGRIQSATVQGILQGESIPHLAQRISRNVGAANYKDAVRYARTAMTGAENAGRQDAYKRAADMGVNLQRRWIATLDMRTRHEHRLLDLQVRDIDEPFEVDGEKIMFPGDPTAEPSLVWNCRCTEVPVVAGWDRKSGALRSDEAIGGHSYEEWREGHVQPERITKQEEIGEAMRQKVIAEDYSGNMKASTNRFGEQIVWDEKMDGEKWDEPKKIVSDLCERFESKLKMVVPGAHKGAGTVQISGTIMNLSSVQPNVVVHEFAHTISMANQTKFGLYDEGDFWKDIRRVQRNYRKEVGSDTTRWISSYEHSSKDVDEFMAEAFALAELSEMGLPIPPKYGNDLTFANQVLDIIKRYFEK